MTNQFTRKPGLGNRVQLSPEAVPAVTVAILILSMVPLRSNAQTLAGEKASTQSGDTVLQFEVASIKRTDPNQVGSRVPPGPSSPGRFRASATLTGLAMDAYGLKQQFEIDWKSPWMGTELFAVEAKVPAGSTKAQVRIMLQRLLAERFGLVIHRETRQLPGYRLVVAKGGAKLHKSGAAPANMGEAAPGPSPTQNDVVVKNGTPQFSGSAGTGELMTLAGTILRGRHESMEGLAYWLALKLHEPVADATGLEGEYGYDLSFQTIRNARTKESAAFVPGGGVVVLPPNAGPEVTPQTSTEPSVDGRPTVWDAIKEQLGLQLDAIKSVPVGVLVLEKAKGEPTEN